MTAIALLRLLLAAAIRIEKKLDELLKLSLAEAKSQKGPLVTIEPLNYPTQSACPMCQKQVTYIPIVLQELKTPVLVRVCGCEPKTNQLPVQGDQQ
jgi:hypothetical protein